MNVRVNPDALEKIIGNLNELSENYTAALAKFQRAGDMLGYVWTSGPDCSTKLGELSGIYNNLQKYSESFLTISQTLEYILEMYNATDNTSF